MKQFSGFPARTQYTSVANIFINSLVPEIEDINELKVTLYVFEMLYRKRGSPVFVSFSEIRANPSVILTFNAVPDIEEAVNAAMSKAVARGIFQQVPIKGEKPDSIYLLNTESNCRLIAKIQNGELKLEGLDVEIPPARLEEPPDIFKLYEDNIGLLTPMIADELKAAEKLYPASWIHDAIKIALSNNKRSWSYISKILERWTLEGKNDGTDGRNLAPAADPDKYIKGKYGHLVQR